MSKHYFEELYDTQPSVAYLSQELEMGKKAKTVHVNVKKITKRPSLKTKSLKERFGVRAANTKESKFFDVSFTAQPVTGSGLVGGIFFPIEGDDFNMRTGRKCQITSVTYDFTFANTTTGLSTSTGLIPVGTDSFKMALVYDKQTNGANPSWSDVYTTTGATAPFANRNVNNIDRFIVLSEEIGTIDYTGSVCQRRKKYVACQHDTRFNSNNAGAATDVSSGGFYWVIADSNTTGNQPATITIATRVRYHDD